MQMLEDYISESVHQEDKGIVAIAEAIIQEIIMVSTNTMVIPMN